jgi:hypothetical protein
VIGCNDLNVEFDGNELSFLLATGVTILQYLSDFRLAQWLFAGMMGCSSRTYSFEAVAVTAHTYYEEEVIVPGTSCIVCSLISAAFALPGIRLLLPVAAATPLDKTPAEFAIFAVELIVVRQDHIAGEEDGTKIPPRCETVWPLFPF